MINLDARDNVKLRFHSDGRDKKHDTKKGGKKAETWTRYMWTMKLKGRKIPQTIITQASFEKLLQKLS